MKTDSVFKRAFNDARDIVVGIGSGGALPSENELSEQLGVSRTTVRKVLSELTQQKMVSGSGRERSVTGKIRTLKKYPLAQTISVADQVERRFMEWMLRDNMVPGTSLNELDLARRFGVATTVIREFLNRFQHFGLIEKKPNAGWL
ncbi:MAG: GntR family transcriptional regulator, partial [Aestuariivirga sp.]